jgi:Tfp pilus assembly protein PilO
MGRLLRMLGRPGVLAVGLLVVIPPLYFSALVPAQEHLEETRRSVLALSDQARTGENVGYVLHRPDEQLAAFYRVFPEERNSPQLLEKLAALAEKNGISLNEGEYKALPDKGGRLLRFQMALPVKGEYRQIRAFLTELSTEIPVLALENVQFTRRDIADATVEARIRLALYLEQAS